jgi:hypothetical protein
MIAYLVLLPRLPATIPLHFGASGGANSFGPPSQLVEGIVVAILILSVVFVAECALPDDEGRVTRRVRGRGVNLLFLVFPVLILVTMGGTTDLLLAGDAHDLPPSLPVPGFAIAVGVGALAVSTVATLLLWMAVPEDWHVKPAPRLRASPATHTFPALRLGALSVRRGCLPPLSREPGRNIS